MAVPNTVRISCPSCSTKVLESFDRPIRFYIHNIMAKLAQPEDAAAAFGVYITHQFDLCQLLYFVLLVDT